MSRGDAQRIADILDACDELTAVVALHVADGPADEVLLLPAAERLLELIGEAASNVSQDADAAHPDVDWRSFARLRIVLAHHYHRADSDLIWSYTVEQAPMLAAALRI
jgi:uncharacterized protein with HEPN domain